MNGQRSLEREIQATLDDHAPMQPPNHLLHTFEFNAERARRYPRWLALIKEPPMRTADHLAVGSPTVRVAAILAATMLLILTITAAGFGARRLLAADDPIVVAQDGSGTHTTLAAAIADAADGDEILIRPGTYAESIITDKSVSLTGDGPPADIVITHTDAGPGYGTGWTAADFYPGDRGPDDDGYGDWVAPSDELGTLSEPTGLNDREDQRFALVLVGTTAEISDVTFSGEHARLFIDGGSPVIEHVTFDRVGRPFTPANSEDSRVSQDTRGNTQALIITGGATPTVRKSALVDGGGIDIYADASPLVEDNTLEGGASVYGFFGDDTRILDNYFFGTGEEGVTMGGDSAAMIMGNVIEDKTDGILLYGQVTAEDNEIRNSTHAGITVTRGDPVVRDNRLYDNAVGIDWERGDGMLEGNEIAGGTHGIIIGTGALVVSDNVIEGVGERGIFADSMSTPVLTGNRSCGNGEDLRVMGTSRPEIDDTNEFCNA